MKPAFGEMSVLRLKPLAVQSFYFHCAGVAMYENVSTPTNVQNLTQSKTLNFDITCIGVVKPDKLLDDESERNISWL